MMKRAFYAITVIAGAMLALVGFSGAATAAQSGASHGAFSAQARSLGLSSAQADQLQARVDREVRQTHGVQVAVNEVRYNGGATVLTLPGERSARPLTANASARGTINRCPSRYFCVYTKDHYLGNMHELFHCNQYYSTVLYGWESYTNNQTEGVRARFYIGHDMFEFSRPAISSEPYTPEGEETTAIMPCYQS